jgi:hypothetical protein
MSFDFLSDHFGVHDNPTGVGGMQRFFLQLQNSAMEAAGPKSAPPGEVPAALFEPDTMDAIARAINILAKGAFQAENAVVAVGLEMVLNGAGKAPRTIRPAPDDKTLVDSEKRGGVRRKGLVRSPGFGEEMKLVPGCGEAGDEALEVKLRTAYRRKGAADQGEFHSSFSLRARYCWRTRGLANATICLNARRVWG